MGLSERKKKILKAVVEENIKANEPVSSQKIVDDYLQDVSSATIRNELMALEEMGLLYHPHTSSGRLPTPEGLRHYVEELMPTKKLSQKELFQIKSSFDKRLSNLEDVIKSTAKTISDATNYASVVYTGLSDEAVVDNIQLFRVNDNLALIIVVTDVGVLKNLTMRCNLPEKELKHAGEVMTKIFSGRTLGEIEENDFKISVAIDSYKEVFNEVIKIVLERDNDFRENFEVAGKENLLNYPEYQDINKFKNALTVMNRQDILQPLLESDGNVEVSIRIGGDKDSGLKDCSLVSAVYKINGKQVGSAGVIGPVRMDYAKAVSVLKSVAKSLEENLNDFVKGDENGQKE